MGFGNFWTSDVGIPKNPLFWGYTDFAPPKTLSTRLTPKNPNFLKVPWSGKTPKIAKNPKIPILPLYKHVVVKFWTTFDRKSPVQFWQKSAVQTGRPLELNEFVRYFQCPLRPLFSFGRD